MSRTRSVFLAACCGALALPAFAWADPPSSTSTGSTGGGPSTDTAASCDYERVCAERARAQAAARAQQRARAQRRTAVRSARQAAGRPEPQTAGATMHVDTRITRNVADGCQYTAKARGNYRADSHLASDADGRIRNVNVIAGTVLTCGDRVVRRQSQRWVFPSTTRAELTRTMEERLAIQVPGSSCTFSSRYTFQAGNLLAQGVSSSCGRRDEVAALQGFMTGGAEQDTARGGGPAQRQQRDDDQRSREPTSDDARYGTH